ncbi:MAG: hypothetical protein JNL08_14555 [Planctomycetes bacterium]|nr:hypothetical protein [Planctomycetota bacterium]
MIAAAFGAAALAVCATALSAQAQLLWVLPDRGVAVGEPFAAEFECVWPAGALPAPLDGAALAPLEVRFEPAPAGGRQRLRAVAWASGDIVLPPMVCRATAADGGPLQQSVAVPPLRVRSVLPTPDPGVEWPELFAASSRRRPSWPWWGLALLLLLGGFVALRRRRVAPVAAAAPSAAARALAELAALVPPAAGADGAAVLAFYTALAATVRSHAGRHGRAPAATRTTTELMACVGTGRAELRRCLECCDAVKFAAAAPGADAHAAALAAARAYVQEDSA